LLVSTLSIADIPLDVEAPAQRLRRKAAAVRVTLHWWGVHRALTPSQKEEFGAATAADARLLTAGKKLIDTRHEAVRKLASVRTRVSNYWRGLTLPYTEPGVRLIRQADIEPFAHTMQGFRQELAAAAADLDAVYEEVKADAGRRLGRLFNPADYPAQVGDLFAVEWDFPAVEPPAYLLRVSPELYAEEQRRVARRFEEAVQLAEQAFLAEFAKLVAHLTERLGGGDGERRVFRDSAVTNLLDFFETFRRLNVRSNQELDQLVDQAQQLVRGVTPQDLRTDDGLRGRIAGQMGRVQADLDAMLVLRPRRRIVRQGASHNGGGHAPGD
jgi:hypothetical protein